MISIAIHTLTIAQRFTKPVQARLPKGRFHGNIPYNNDT